MAGTKATEQEKNELSPWKKLLTLSKAHPWVRKLFNILILILLAVAVSFILAVILWAVRPNDSPSWTGFASTDLPLYTGISPYKSLWDWLGLLIVPLFLALGAAILGRAQQNREFRAHETERKIAEEAKQNEWAIEKDRQEGELVELYYTRMTEFLLQYDLRSSSSDDDIRYIARATTLSVFRGINAARKGQVLKFLYEAHLINTPDPIVNLEGADLQLVELESAVLSKAHLASTDMHKAKLNRADLSGSNLSGANLIDAGLRKADLKKALLSEAFLSGAHLREATLDTAVLKGSLLNDASMIQADLHNTDLSDGNLVGADLSQARLQGANLSGAKCRPARAAREGEDDKTLVVLEATYNASTTWPDDYDPAAHGAVLVEK